MSPEKRSEIVPKCEFNNEIAGNLFIKALGGTGVRVDREAFLADQFGMKEPEMKKRIMDVGPVKAGCTKEELRRLAEKCIFDNASESTAISVVVDLSSESIGRGKEFAVHTIQFVVIALKLAQQLAYLYGDEDCWSEGEERASQLRSYFGIMLGIGTASATVRFVSSSLAMTASKKLPRASLTKTSYYPVVKDIANTLNVRMNKDIFSDYVSKCVRYLGGMIIPGVVNFFSMKKMGQKLMTRFEEEFFLTSTKETQYS